MPLSACRGACYLANSAIDRRIHEITAESNFQKRTGRVYGSNDSRDYRASAPGCVAHRVLISEGTDAGHFSALPEREEISGREIRGWKVQLRIY